MNLLDNLIRAVAPEAALRRARARAALRSVDLLTRGYDAAKVGRRTAGWVAGNASANVEIGNAWSRTVARSRDLVRNNPYARKAISSMVRNLVRTGIKTKWDKKATQAKWNDWVDVSDAMGQLDFYGQQGQLVQAWKESGEVLIRFRYEPSSRGMPVPLTIMVLEADFLDHTKTGPLENGNYAITGVEFDSLGRRVAYWLFDQHPGDVVMWKAHALQSKRVPASEVVHLYKIERPGQVRGMPQLAASTMRLRDMDDYQEAELVRKKIEACFVAFVFGRDGETVGEDKGVDGGSTLEQVRPGMIKQFPDSTDVKFGSPSASNDSSYTREQLQAIATGCDVTYEQLTGDLSQVNYSSIRAGMVEYRALIEMEQWLTFIPMVLKPIAREWTRIGYLSGALRPAPGSHSVKFTTPKIDWVDPLKETLAVKEQIKAGLTSISEALRERGYDPEEVFAEIAKERELLGSMGITTDVIVQALSAAAGGAVADTTSADATGADATGADASGADATAGDQNASRRLIEVILNQ